jgi:hypothetical protein
LQVAEALALLVVVLVDLALVATEAVATEQTLGRLVQVDQ